MPDKQRPNQFPPGRPRPRPGQDMYVTPPGATNFPSVGMTLRSYKTADSTSGYRPAGPLVVRRSRWSRLRAKVTLRRTVLVLALIVLLLGVFLGGKIVYNAHKLFGGSIFSILNTTKLKGEDTGRVNILLAGNSSDDPGHEGGNLTDSVMLISIDTKNNQAFMMSIPRDLWVDIPDDGHAKLNAAYVAGQSSHFRQSGYPNGGMGQLEQIVEENFGIPIDYYALIDYNALKQSVDAVGGIDITVQSSDRRGLYDPSIDYATHGPLVRLTNGTHHLNGEQALDFARARGDAYGSYGFPQSDFDRTAHQRQMLLALKSKAVSAGVLSNPARLSSLFDAIGGNVKTDMSLGEVRRLYDLTKNTGSGNIKSLSLNSANGKNLLTNYQAPDGESALIPAAGIDDFSQIQAYLKQLTSHDPVVRENASVVVLNATASYGLASRERTTLEAKNLNVTTVGDAGTAASTVTTIIDNSHGAKPATRQLLGQLFGSHFTATNPYAAVYKADFIVVLGNDQAGQ